MSAKKAKRFAGSSVCVCGHRAENHELEDPYDCLLCRCSGWQDADNFDPTDEQLARMIYPHFRTYDTPQPSSRKEGSDVSL